MPSPSLSHVVGTSAFLASLILVTAGFGDLGRYVACEAADAQLAAVAEYVASTMQDLVSIANSSTQDSILIRCLKIPTDVNGQGYSLSIRSEFNWIEVQAQLETIPKLSGEAFLPWNASAGISVVAVDDDMGTWEKREEVHSGAQQPMIWCLREHAAIQVGLGVFHENSTSITTVARSATSTSEATASTTSSSTTTQTSSTTTASTTSQEFTLNAFSVDGGIRLEWGSVPGASLYVIRRTTRWWRSKPWPKLGETSDTGYDDYSVRWEGYYYVEAFQGGVKVAESNVASASPG